MRQPIQTAGQPSNLCAAAALPSEPGAGTANPPPPLDPRVPRSSEPRRLVIVGESHRSRRVRKALSELPLEVTEHVDFRHAIARDLTRSTAGLVLVPPLRGILAEHAVSLARERSPLERLPVVVIVPDEFPDERSAELYRRGAAGVLSWFTDAAILASLISHWRGWSGPGCVRHVRWTPTSG